MPVTDQQYADLVYATPDTTLELVCGEVREKPSMTTEHNDVIEGLYAQLLPQLDRNEFRIRSNSGRARIPAGDQFVPDLFVLPVELLQRLRARPGTFEAYADPLPLIVEVWSPSTGRYDVDTKIPEYQQRGDAEIWRIHPYQRALTAWRQQPDGSYAMLEQRGGVIQPIALPGVTIDIDRLFD